MTVKQDKLSRPYLLVYLVGTVPVIWIALLIAPYVSGGLPQIMANFGYVMDHPLHIQFCEDSLRTVLILLLIYGLCLGVYLSYDRNYRRREEHGSAQWGSAELINKKYADKELSKNKIFTRNVSMGMDGRKHRRNLNTVCVGGSGAGKTRNFAKPCIMYAACIYVILDPKVELIRAIGWLLKKLGYVIKVVDLINMEKSHCYNPFHYIKKDDDIQKMVTNLFKNTTPKGSQ